MSYKTTLTLYCDNCGYGEDYDEECDDIDQVPEDWETDYDDGASIFAHVCGECVKEFKEENDGTDGADSLD